MRRLFLSALLALALLAFVLFLFSSVVSAQEPTPSPSPSLTPSLTPTPAATRNVLYVPTDYPGTPGPVETFAPPAVTPALRCRDVPGCSIVCGEEYCLPFLPTPIWGDWGDVPVSPTPTPAPIGVTLHYTPAGTLDNWSCVVTHSLSASWYPAVVARCVADSSATTWCYSGSPQFVGDSWGLDWWLSGWWSGSVPDYAIAAAWYSVDSCVASDHAICEAGVDSSGVPGQPAPDVEFPLGSWHSWSDVITGAYSRYWNAVGGVKLSCYESGWLSVDWQTEVVIYYWFLHYPGGEEPPDLPDEPPGGGEGGGGGGIVVPIWLSDTVEIPECLTLTDCCVCTFEFLVSPIVTSTRCLQVGPFPLGSFTSLLDAVAGFFGFDSPDVPDVIDGLRVCVTDVRVSFVRHPLTLILTVSLVAVAVLFVSSILWLIIRR